MAVYKRNYKGYAGAITPKWSRFLILTRYSYARLFQSRFLVIFLIICFIPPIIAAAWIYLSHNLKFLSLMQVPESGVRAIGGWFFYYYCFFPSSLAFIMAVFIGPNLVSPDLVNGALPLYFCRPFSRTQYVAGKLGVLMALLSLITWIPGLLLFLIQSSVAGSDWMSENLYLAWGIFLGLFVWILVLSLISLALSAWVKWKIAAGALLLGVFFAGAGFGGVINNVMRTSNGWLINLAYVARTLQADLLRFDSGAEISPESAWLILAIVSLFCLVLLARRVRAFEVVK